LINELIYSKIQSEIATSNLSINAIARASGLSSGHSLSRALDQQSLRLDVIDNLCTFLGINILEYLGEVSKNAQVSPYVATAGALDGLAAHRRF